MAEETQPSLELAKEWERLQAISGSFKGPPKDETEMQTRKEHKVLVKGFLSSLTVEQRNAFIAPKAKKTESETKASKNSKAPVQFILKPKDGPVDLGWGDPAKQRSIILPFYSHTKRYAIEEYEDEHVFGGLDRRVFSNLYEDDQPIEIDKLEDVNVHSFIYDTPAGSSEQLYQAIKCQEEGDAMFILTELNSLDAARYGQSRLTLTTAQRDWLVTHGIDDEDSFQQRGKGWIRGKNGRLPMRPDWYDIKHLVMLHILRAKFGGPNLGSAASKAVKVLETIPLFVEHTTNDAKWGDGGNGNGMNWLGKCLTRVFLELKGRFTVVEPDAATVDLALPNNLLVKYVPTSIPIQRRPIPTDHLPTPDVLLILDFEATCDKDRNPKPQEIIEWPTLMLSLVSGEVEQVFHHYVKPEIQPKISDFCTELTGITQAQVDAGHVLLEVMQMHEKWLSDNQLVPLYDKDGEVTIKKGENSKTFLCLTCGDWDLKTGITNQLSHMGVSVPSYFDNWVNVKTSFQNHYSEKKPAGMTEMLRRLDLQLEGHHHSGIDDCHNIVRICQVMLKDGWVPTRTSLR